MPVTKTKPSLDLFEFILDEAIEICQRMKRLRTKLRRHRRGSEAYCGVMSEIGVAATELEIKTESLERENDAIVYARPDDDSDEDPILRGNRHPVHRVERSRN